MTLEPVPQFLAVECPEPETQVTHTDCLTRWLNVHSDSLPLHLEIINPLGVRRAITWCDAPVFAPDPVVQMATVDVVEMADGTTCVLSHHIDSSLDVLRLLPDELCPISKVVTGVTKGVDRIVTPEIGQFVRNILSLSPAMPAFWTAPAAKDHHTYRGGLALHSLEVMEKVFHFLESGKYRPDRWSTVEQDMAIAYGLLHDFGRCASYLPDGSLCERSRVLGHQMLSYELMYGPLQTLERTRPDMADVMRKLISGTFHTADSRDFRIRDIGAFVTSADTQSRSS